ncbi:serine/threonine protein kinase, partial [Fischerella thermalis WC542]
KISLTREILGVKCPPILTAPRQNIVKIELTRLSYKRDSEGGTITIPPQINIWVGIKKFELGGKDYLTNPELDWLAHNLSSWLNLPITRD